MPRAASFQGLQNAAKKPVAPHVHERLVAAWTKHNKKQKANASAADATHANNSYSEEEGSDDSVGALISISVTSAPAGSAASLAISRDASSFSDPCFSSRPQSAELRVGAATSEFG